MGPPEGVDERVRRGTSGVNALIAIDKPCGMTSHDVVARVRRALGEGRVGHAGTLDPDASGVMVVGIGQGTRLMGSLTAERKGYAARIRFGVETSTDDAAGEVVATAPVPPELADARQAAAFLSTLVGPMSQVPPSFSAISVGGVRSYARARAGERFVLEPRDVQVFESRLEGVDDADGIAWDCAFVVSKGCYIRAIARDVGRAVGTRAHLEALRRISSGSVGIGECLSLATVDELGAGGIATAALDPADKLDLPVRALGTAELDRVRCGKALTAPSGAPARVSLVSGTRLYGIWRLLGDAYVSEATFPDGIVGVRR